MTTCRSPDPAGPWVTGIVHKSQLRGVLAFSKLSLLCSYTQTEEEKLIPGIHLYAYSEKETTIEINMMIRSCLLLLHLLRSAVSQSIITGLTLVNSATDEDIRALVDQDIIDLDAYSGIQLTIRAEVDSGAAIDQIEFDLDDGAIIRSEGTAPFYLGGDVEGDADAVNTLQVTGRHTLTVTVLVNGVSVGALSIEFVVTDSGLADETMPTTTPVSIYDVPGYDSSSYGEVNGELKKWHKITIGFSGRPTAETNNIANPFTDLRLIANHEYV